MSTTLKIRVTSETIRKAKNDPCRTNACAIALAVRDVFPKADVGGDSICPFGVDDVSRRGPILLPETARRFIREFDCKITAEEREQMPEIEFEVVIPDSVLQHIDISEVTERLSNHPTLELINV